MGKSAVKHIPFSGVSVFSSQARLIVVESCGGSIGVFALFSCLPQHTAVLSYSTYIL